MRRTTAVSDQPGVTAPQSVGFTLIWSVFSPSSTRELCTGSAPGRTLSIVTTSPGAPLPPPGQARPCPDTGGTVPRPALWRRDHKWPSRPSRPSSPRCGEPGQSSVPAAVSVVAARPSASESVSWPTWLSVLISTRLRSGPATSTPATNRGREASKIHIFNKYLFFKVQFNQIKTIFDIKEGLNSSSIKQ